MGAEGPEPEVGGRGGAGVGHGRRRWAAAGGQGKRGASVASTDFTTGAATANETIAKADVSYWSGLATAESGTDVRVPGQSTAAAAASLSGPTPLTAFSASGAVGNNDTTWIPTIVINDASSVPVGTYSGTVTHSVL